uniref:Uncharacterized protein n=1 Tax=Clastoptera arizonana TaxID=38151 RepID=A0A1B6C665_9HEMI
MSTCQRFLQNAWKKDLCSNCFKSKDEHVYLQESKSRYLTSLKHLSNTTPPQGILKKDGTRKKLVRVKFCAEESYVIGYGGEEVSDDDEDIIENPVKEVEVGDEGLEEDKDLLRITKSNTEFNSNPANLTEKESPNLDVKKPYFTPLLLGKPQKDADGRKQTLLVSVKPFGAETSLSPSSDSKKEHNNTPIKEFNSVSVLKQNKTTEEKQFKTEGVDIDDSVPFKESNESAIHLNNSTSSNSNVITDSHIQGNDSTINKNEDVANVNNRFNISTPLKFNTLNKNKQELDINMLNHPKEVKKSQLTRGSMLTKTHDQSKQSRLLNVTNSLKPENGNEKTDTSLSNMRNNHNNEKVKSFNTIEQNNIKNLSGGMYTSRLVYTDISTSSEESDSSGIETPHINKDVFNFDDKNNFYKPTANLATKDVNCVQVLLKNVSDTFSVNSSSESEFKALDIPESREMAGEPDGRADPDEIDDDIPPDLPSSPPPQTTEHTPRSSFLHNFTKERPKIPTKPKFSDSYSQKAGLPSPDKNKNIQFLLSNDAKSTSIENGRSTKRQAPKPPAGNIDFNKIVVQSSVSESQEKKESEQETNFTSVQREVSDPLKSTIKCDIPETTSKSFIQSDVTTPTTKIIVKSEASDSISKSSVQSEIPDSKSKSSVQREGSDSPPKCSAQREVLDLTPKSSFQREVPDLTTKRLPSLSQDNLTSTNISDKKRSNKVRSTLKKFLRLASREEDKLEEGSTSLVPSVRPRLEIIHPLDINKSAVQVLRADGSSTLITKAVSSATGNQSPETLTVQPNFGRPNKPPPPPRSQSLDLSSEAKPVRPPPPKVDLAHTKRHSTALILTDTVYANIGEIRSGIAPNKPQRTASIRECSIEDLSPTASSYYEPFQVTESQVFNCENLYESLAPECDLNRERSSLPYCGSETESDIYFPYTSNSTPKLDDESDTLSGSKSRKLRVVKGRSIVHKSLEDNYGAVVVANHEALSQLLEQMNRSLTIPAQLRVLKSTSNLSWSDFTVLEESKSVVIGERVFLSALWNMLPVTLCLTMGQSRVPNSLSPITQFFDLVASKYVHHEKTELVQVSVAVLVHQQVFTIHSYGDVLKEMADSTRETALVMVQIVNGLKNLQASGIEDTHLSEFVLCKDEREYTPRLCLLRQESDSKTTERVSLCQCAISAFETLPAIEPLNTLLCSILIQERATSLSQVKAALELWLWGPNQIPTSSDIIENLQRWLDLERATLLQHLVINRPSLLNTADYCHVAFLVRTNAKIMADAITLLEKPNTSSC